MYLKYFCSFAVRFLRGSWYGLRNFTISGVRVAGLKRSLGFIIQSVENWSRYPEFYVVENSLSETLPGDIILDLGSPKMFGLLLSDKREGTHFLTDIWKPAIDEFQNLVRFSTKSKSNEIKLQVADATSLASFANESVTLIYSISVLEHIPKENQKLGLELALPEIWRVLKPGGTAVVSLPVGVNARDEFKDESVYAKSHSGAPIFFQHIYDAAEILNIVAQFPKLRHLKTTHISWNLDLIYLALWRKVPQKIRGTLGFVNLLLAPASFEIHEMQIDQTFFMSAGDCVLVFKKDL